MINLSSLSVWKNLQKMKRNSSNKETQMYADSYKNKFNSSEPKSNAANVKRQHRKYMDAKMEKQEKIYSNDWELNWRRHN